MNKAVFHKLKLSSCCALLSLSVSLSSCNSSKVVETTSLNKTAKSEVVSIENREQIVKDLAASRVQFSDTSLLIDGKEVPQLYGAELQYFRIRGGYGPNVPKEKVEALWRQALSRMKEAGMNAICFYIPWDFHEYKEGHFDFDGTVDEDNDGRPDYPSRNLKLFFKLVAEAGIEHIMARPGPYINAEWGFLGFGAIPEWFHDKYRSAHMVSSSGALSKLYDYNSPDLLRHTELWFKKLHNDVLKEYIGPGKPIFAMQVDNETNYQWQSIHNVDYSGANQERFREFLKNKHSTLAALNLAHGSSYETWDHVIPPESASPSVGAKHDWYEFADISIYKYLEKIQKIWLSLGVTHKDVLFTLAESYNAMRDGLIPHLNLRNSPTTGMYTVNLYPKTADVPKYENQQPILDFIPQFNNPFKADHDVVVADAANDLYFLDSSKKNEWVMGPEIQGGWWKGTVVTPEARKQTYLTTLGHGLKAIFIYYFHEGDNWGADWEATNIKKIFDRFRSEEQYMNIPEVDIYSYGENRPQIVNEFWEKVSSTYTREYFLVPPTDKNWAQWTMLSSFGPEKIRIAKLYNHYRGLPEYKDLPEIDLHSYGLNRLEIVNQFWAKVQGDYATAYGATPTGDRDWAQFILLSDNERHRLYFDAPLDRNMDPKQSDTTDKKHFDFVVEFGQKLIQPYKYELGRATRVVDDIVILKDAADHAPQDVSDLNNVLVNTDWSAGLYAYFLHVGYSPSFSIVEKEIEIPSKARTLVRTDYTRKLSDVSLARIKRFLSQGGTVINVLEDSLAVQLGMNAKEKKALDPSDRAQALKYGELIVEDGEKTKPHFARAYTLYTAAEKPDLECKALLKWGQAVVAYSCKVGEGTFVQLGTSLQDIYNANEYYLAKDLKVRNLFLRSLLVNNTRTMDIVSTSSKVVAFSRTFDRKLWITVKSGEGAESQTKIRFWKLNANRRYRIKDLLQDTVQELSGAELATGGFLATLKSYDSSVYLLEELDSGLAP